MTRLEQEFESFPERLINNADQEETKKNFWDVFNRIDRR